MDEEAELDTQRRRLVTKSSSIKRKPLANLTNIIHKQSKKPASSTASDSSIGSTQNQIHLPRPIIIPPGQQLPSQPQRLTTDCLVGDENRNSVGQRQSTQNTRSNTKDAVAFRQKYFEGTRNAGKEGSVSLCSSTLEKVKDQGNVNQSCLDNTKNDGKILYKRKTIDVPLGAHHTKNSNNSVNTHIPHSTVKIKDVRLLKNSKNNVDTSIPRSTVNIKDKGKENIVLSGYSLAGNAHTDMDITIPDSLMMRNEKGKAIAVPLDYRSIKNVKSKLGEARIPLKGVIIKERGATVMGSSRVDLAQKDNGKAVVTPNSVMNRKDKGKAIVVPYDYPSMKYRKGNMVEVHVPLKDRGETVSGSSCVDPVQKDEGKAVATPINYRNLEKKDKRRSCPPLLRATSNRSDAHGAEDIIQFKPQTEPPPNKKKRRCSSKEEYTLPQEYVEQQRAYFKEIDDYELEVEEV